MLTFDEAKKQIMHAAGLRAGVESVALAQAPGRVLAADVTATCQVPPFANSAMDGFAVRAQDVTAGGALAVSQTLYAGMPARALQPGTAARVFTGSMLPQGADTVIAQEDCVYDAQEVVIHGEAVKGRHIRAAGEDIEKGEVLLAVGTRLQPVHTGLLASTGVSEVKVFTPLRVGLLATGSELVSPGRPLAPGQIYNSNLPMLQALLQQQGYQVDARMVADDLQAIQQVLAELAKTCDAVISIGGVSVGDADLVRQAITREGHVDLWKVAMKPGKPLALGQVHDTPVLGLPGNPVSAYVVLQLFGLDYLGALQGARRKAPLLQQYPLELAKPMTPGRETFLRVRLYRHDQDGELRLQPYPNQGSGVLRSVAFADGLARVPMDKTTQDRDQVLFIPFV